MVLDTYPAGATLYCYFGSYNSSGASVALTGLAVTDIEIYKAGSVTQRASDAGYTLLDTDGIDFDGVTGINGFSIDLNDNTDTGFFAVGSQYVIVVSAVTIDSQTVNIVCGQFRIVAAESVAGKPKVDVDAFGGTAGTFASGRPEVNTTHAAGTAWGSGAITAGVIAADAIGASELAADAASEIGTAVWATATRVLTANTNLNDPTAAAIADAVWDEVLSGASHNVANSAGRRLRSLQDNGLYALASVWVDEVAGTSTGTTSYEDATVTNRSNDFDNAQTVANAIDIKSIQVSNGNSITLTAALEGYNLYGSGSVLALGSQNLGGTIIREFGTITGIGTSTGNPVFFEDCLLGAVTLPPSVLQQCGIGLSGGTFTIGSAGDFLFVDCYSRVAGSAAPIVDLAAVGATTVEFRRWSGGLTLNNVATGDVVSVDVVSGGTITVNGTGGTVVIRGHCDVVDGSSGSVTITQTSVVNMTKINSEVLDVLNTDTFAEPTGVPAATATLATKLGVLYMALRNRVDVTSSKKTFYGDDGVAEFEKDLSDDGTTYSETEVNAI
ncbi:MAG: hypothetical protein VW338_00045 [Rhodospirillaceae bacterium]